MGGGLWQQLASAELTRDECVLSRLPSLVLATAGHVTETHQYSWNHSSRSIVTAKI